MSAQFKHTGPASGRLWMSLWDNYTDAEKKQLIEDFQSELAEKIRRKCRELYGSPVAHRPGMWADEGYGLLDAADLIDPKEKK